MSPRTPIQFREIREEKRKLIMDVALEHFANEGFERTTINHIAKHAGISKGLMYNYFRSKDELLHEIINRSVDEVYLYFDTDRDGILSEAEFEYFIIRLTSLLYEKKNIWRLFFRMMLQNEVRQHFRTENAGSKPAVKSGSFPPEEEFIPGISDMISDYFLRKVVRKPEGYDHILEMSLFLMTLKGFVATFIFADSIDEVYFHKVVDSIIQRYR